MKAFFFLIIFFTSPIQLFAQHKTKKVKLPAELKEISGLEKFNDTILIAINDGGNSPELFFINLKGEIIKKTNVTNALNIDWEDLTMDDKGNLYIADVGNNLNKRRDLSVLKMNALLAYQCDSIQAEKIYFSYADQQNFSSTNELKLHDCEAIFWHNDSLHLLTKITSKPTNDYWSNGTSEYTLPSSPGTYIVTSKTHYWTGGDNRLKHQVTACDNTNENIAILTYGFVYFYRIGPPLEPVKKSIRFKRLTQKEALVIQSEKTLFIGAERHRILGGPFLYTIELK